MDEEWLNDTLILYENLIDFYPAAAYPAGLHFIDVEVPDGHYMVMGVKHGKIYNTFKPKE